MEIKDIGNQLQLEKMIRSVIRSKTKPEQKPSSAGKTSAKRDKVAISADAEFDRKIAHFVELVKKMPDIRPEEIERVKKKLAEGAYNNDEVLEKTVEKMLEELES